jgi:23S rRNA pseudouridine2605 synthase
MKTSLGYIGADSFTRQRQGQRRPGGGPAGRSGRRRWRAVAAGGRGR